MPSFYWGRMPSPGLAEYYSRHGYYDLLYALPYVLAGLMVTIAGCVAAPLLLRTFGRWSSRAFTGTAVITMALLLLLAFASDAGSLLGLWNGPLFCLHRGGFGLYDLVVLSKVFLPASLLAGVVEVG